MSARRWPLLLGLSLVGCGGLFDNTPKPTVACRSDLECADDEVCFVDGCGDPGKDIAVEVTPTARNGAYPQDFALDTLKASQTLRLYAPSLLQGTLVREQDGAEPAPYTGTVSLVLSGQSAVIPGLSRHFEATLDTSQTNTPGAYAFPVGSGVYAVSATPSDPKLPPLFEPGRQIDPGKSETLDLVFPKASELVSLSGVVVRSVGIPSTDALQIQAVGATGEPLSQAVPLGTGGTFSLSVTTATLARSEIDLRVSPIDPQALLPTKTFTLAPLAQLTDPLELGDFGAPFTFSGILLDGAQQPVEGASVHLEGTVAGGGSFRSPVVMTGADGSFSLQTLAEDTPGSLSLFAVPASGSTSGILVARGLSIQPGAPGVTLTCPNKISVLGSVLTPDGGPAAGVKVTAVPIAELDAGTPDLPLPSAGADVTTDDTGAFTMALDPAQYRLDFVPSTKLPRLSRFVEVSADAETSPDTQTLEVPPFTLSRGRSATGHVEVLASDGGTSDVAAAARVRFYRRVDNGDTPSSVLLDQAYADENGDFTVLLPTR